MVELMAGKKQEKVKYIKKTNNQITCSESSNDYSRQTTQYWGKNINGYPATHAK